jgi:hypothetical protein
VAAQLADILEQAIEPASGLGHCAEIPVSADEDLDLCDHCMSRVGGVPQGERCDQTELALSDLVDQADEAVLALADSLLSDHPAWRRMRQLQDDVFSALCDYRALARA